MDALAEQVMEVNGKGIAFDFSPREATDFQFCIFSLRNASNHNLYCCVSAPTLLIQRTLLAFSGRRYHSGFHEAMQLHKH